MTTKFNIGDTVKADFDEYTFVGVISMIIVTRQGIKYRAYGIQTDLQDGSSINIQDNLWEKDLKEYHNAD